MNRRQLIKTALIGGAALGAGGVLAAWIRTGNDAQRLTVDAVLLTLDRLAKTELTSSGAWNPHQILSHCAQTVEYSMSGYPEQKSVWFQDTVGALAFSTFSARGRMTHDLNEPIPGAPLLESQPRFQDGLTRLHTALTSFRDFQGALAPHFAYGKLNKREYEIAHAMHFWNHLDEIKV
ncbi:MAG TPA: DUF1569 domain-containing protein [Paucimonas sp.]|nr:DUF1569 domain-containing protein [Paucimonas sp.]